MEHQTRVPDLNIQTAVDKLKAQVQFCKREKDRFKQSNAQDSTMFYEGKLQDFKWQTLQLQQHYQSTGEVLRLRRESVSVPVAADNERLLEEQLELDISDVFYNPTTESKKLYFIRYVICLPLQRSVLQEQKTEMFRTCEVGKVEEQRFFHYPRNDLKVCDSLKRGYLTMELYAERKLKAPSLVGIPQRVSLSRFLEEPSIKGMLSFGDSGEWDISYALNIKRAQLQSEKDNFKMVQKNWICLADDCRITRRASVATMHASPRHHHRKHHRHNRNHHHRHHHHKRDIEETSDGICVVNQSTDSEDSLKEEKSDHIADLPSEKSDCQNKNTTNKLKKTLSRRLSGLF